MTATVASRRTGGPTMRSPAPPAIWSSGAAIAAARRGVARSFCRPGAPTSPTIARCAPMRAGRRSASDARTARRPHDRARLWLPERGGPAFLVGQNFRAVYSYHPSRAYSLALCHLGDLIRGEADFRQPFPGGERAPTLAEVKEIQRRLNALGFKTDGIDGRIGSDTVRAVIAFQKKVGMEPADGYAGLKLLARLRQGG